MQWVPKCFLSCVFIFVFLILLARGTLQAKAFSSHNDDSDDSYDEFTEDEEFQAPIDNVDPFVFFSDIMKGMPSLLVLVVVGDHGTY